MAIERRGDETTSINPATFKQYAERSHVPHGTNAAGHVARETNFGKRHRSETSPRCVSRPALFAVLLAIPFGVGACGGEARPGDPVPDLDAGDTRHGQDAAVPERDTEHSATASDDTKGSSGSTTDAIDRSSIQDDTTIPNTSTDVEQTDETVGQTHASNSTSVDTSPPVTTSGAASEVDAATSSDSSCDDVTQNTTDVRTSGSTNDSGSRGESDVSSTDTNHTDSNT